MCAYYLSQNYCTVKTAAIIVWLSTIKHQFLQAIAHTNTERRSVSVTMETNRRRHRANICDQSRWTFLFNETSYSSPTQVRPRASCCCLVGIAQVAS